MQKKKGTERAAIELAGASALVVGLAVTGQSCARFLLQYCAKVVATDDKGESELGEAVLELKAKGVEIVSDGYERLLGLKFDYVVVSPGVPYEHPLLKAGREAGSKVVSEVELAWRYLDCPVIAIAGTNGKTTTTTLLGKILEAAGKRIFVGGNIGTPAIEAVRGGQDYDYAVLEISSFHLETTHKFNPHIGILLNITEDHLDRYDSFEHYASTKFKLFENQGADDFAIVNSLDPVIAAKIKGSGLGSGCLIRFASSGDLDSGLYVKGEDIVRVDGTSVEKYPIAGFKLKGLHNLENIMAVIAAARGIGITRECILATLTIFSGLPHRMEHVRTLNGVEYIDDSKGTNIGSLQMALRGLEGPVILIAGGRDKGGDYRALAEEVGRKVKLMALIGEARFKINEALGALTKTVLCDTLDEAVIAAYNGAVKGDTVLLCPACSSFDMFKSYKDRGEKFSALVAGLGN